MTGAGENSAGLHDDLAQIKDIPVGEILRRARVYTGQSLEAVERNIRIRAALLDLLEKGDIDRLPGRVYAIGFVRTYSDYLGLDGEKMVELFKMQSVGASYTPEYHFPVAMAESRIGGLRFLFFCGVAALLILALWAGYNVAQMPGFRSVPDAPAAGDADADLNADPLFGPWADLLSDAAENEDEGPAPDAAPEDGIRIRATQNSWVEIRNADGRALFSRILKQDEELTVPAQPGLTLSTGNAGALDIAIDGQKVPRLGAVGDVRRNVPLDPAIFKDMTQTESAE